MKTIIVIGLLAITAQAGFTQTSGFAGAGLETNMNTREGAALGGALSLGLDLDRRFTLGLKTAFSGNLDTLGTLEPSAFFRWYLPLGITGPFLQADIGAGIYFENDAAYPAFMGGLQAGWRFLFNESLFLEAAFRGGYPFAWGLGFGAGVRFGGKGVSHENQN